MKKILAIALALLLMVGMAACDGGENAGNQNAGNENTGNNNGGETTQNTTDEGVYSFTLGGVELIPGAAFDPAKLPAADSVFQVPSCAINGTDDVYNYTTVEVTAFNDGTGAVIYSIFLLDPNTPTPEGLYMGDMQQQVDALYGTNRTVNDTELVYQKGNTQLRIIMDNGLVNSIEYRMVTD